MSKKKISENSDNKDKLNIPDKVEATDECKEPEENRKYLEYLTEKEKKKFQNMMEKSGLTEDELIADAISQYTKRRSLGKKEKAKDHLLLIDDFNKLLASLPPEYQQEFKEYKLKEDMLWGL